MSNRDRRAEGRRRAWGRGPIILRFEPLEGRQLLSSFALTGGGIGNSSSSSASIGSTSSTGTTSAGTSSSTSSTGTTSTGTTSSTSSTGTQGSTTTNTSSTSSTGSALTTAINQATGASSTTQSLPDLISSKLSAPAKLTWGQTFQITGTVTNQGTAATTSPFSVAIYASSQSKIVTGAADLGSVSIPAGLAPGASYTYTLQTTAPKQAIDYFNGQNFYLDAAVDSTNTVTESNEDNNVNLGLTGQDTVSVAVGTTAPNLQAAGLSVSPGAIPWGQTIHVSATIANNGDGDAPATNARIVLAPTGKNPLGSLGYTIGSVAMPSAAAGTSVSASQDIRLPASPPSALAGYTSFTLSMITDSTGAANPVQSAPTFQGAGIDQAPLIIAAPQPTTSPVLHPNLMVAAVDAPSSITWGQTFVVKTNLINLDAGTAGPFKVGFYLSESDAANAPLLSLGEASVAGLTPGQSVSLAQTLQLPASIPTGLDPSATQGRIVVKVDPEHVIDDSNLADNALGSSPVTLNVIGTDGSTTRVVTTSPVLRKTHTGSNSGSSTGSGQTTSGPGTTTTPTVPIVTPSPSIPLTPRQARIQARQQRLATLRLYVEERHQAQIQARERLRLFHPGRHGGNTPA